MFFWKRVGQVFLEERGVRREWGRFFWKRGGSKESGAGFSARETRQKRLGQVFLQEERVRRDSDAVRRPGRGQLGRVDGVVRVHTRLPPAFIMQHAPSSRRLLTGVVVMHEPPEPCSRSIFSADGIGRVVQLSDERQSRLGGAHLSRGGNNCEMPPATAVAYMAQEIAHGHLPTAKTKLIGTSILTEPLPTPVSSTCAPPAIVWMSLRRLSATNRLRSRRTESLFIPPADRLCIM
jgi:hypothetical protein